VTHTDAFHAPAVMCKCVNMAGKKASHFCDAGENEFSVDSIVRHEYNAVY